MDNIKFMDEVKSKGNFWFMYNINKEIYEILASAERLARINFRECGSLTRDALETIITYIIKDQNLEKRIPSNMTLFEQIDYLTAESLIPVMGTVKANYENGKSGEVGFYDFFRRLGNAASHANVRPQDVKVNYKHVCKALKGYHTFLIRYYNKRVSKYTPKFMEDFMPIGEYFIEKAYIPTDTDQSKCVKEFVGHTLDVEGNQVFHAILRLYNKDNPDERFMLRNTDTFVEASKVSISSVPEGMTRMRELVTQHDNKSSFYILAYIFNRKPERLTEKLLQSMDFKKRVKICKRIADCFYNLHKLEAPIYHRLLSDESIYVCDFGREWVPYVIKFDFAKIESGTRGTVSMNVGDAIKMLKEIKYLAPECIVMDTQEAETLKIDWEKVDIYALSILFGDILMAQSKPVAIAIDKLEDIDEISDDMLDLLHEMRKDSPKERPDIEMVLLVLNEEVR